MARTSLSLLAGVLCSCPLWALVSNPDQIILKRGDVNSDFFVDVSDPIYLLNWLYRGGPEPPCLNQADANNDGSLDSSDSICLFNWLYINGPDLPPPGPLNRTCSVDDPPYLSCSRSPCL